MANKYLLDANIFMQSKNREYRFDFAAAFWDWIEEAHSNDVAFSCQKVLEEIQRGAATCPLRKWSGGLPKGFFLPDEKDGGVMTSYGNVMGWAYAQSQYTPKALADFASRSNADAFLIAVAKNTGMTIVTHETSSPDARVRIPIPNAATALGVKTVVLFDLLSVHATATFKFKQ